MEMITVTKHPVKLGEEIPKGRPIFSTSSRQCNQLISLRCWVVLLTNFCLGRADTLTSNFLCTRYQIGIINKSFFIGMIYFYNAKFRVMRLITKRTFLGQHYNARLLKNVLIEYISPKYSPKQLHPTSCHEESETRIYSQLNWALFTLSHIFITYISKLSYWHHTLIYLFSINFCDVSSKLEQLYQ